MNDLVIRDDQLPTNYIAAKTAIAECARVDECKEWRDKALALAAYYRMSEDRTMYDAANRIGARAMRRAGELALQIEEDKGGRVGRIIASGGAPTSNLGRFATTAEAGFSKDQTVTAIKLARMPKEEFERRVEATPAPTITDLIGDRKPADFVAATHFIYKIPAMEEVCAKANFLQVNDGISDKERRELIEHTKNLIARLNQLLNVLENRND
jgi:hypothetical protein